jgi:uncharacterized repeat protein (TIGR01451 family)
MARIIRRLPLLVILALVVSACNLGATTNRNNAALANTATAPTVELAILTDIQTFATAGQVIQYRYQVKNTGASPIPGVIVFTGTTSAPVCPNVNTVGNQDTYLDAQEAIICTSSYTTTQADLTLGKVANAVTANVNGTLSNVVTITVNAIPERMLTLAKSANPATYDRAGLTIIYTYVIKNSGSLSLGPAQFTVSDAGIGAGAPINCGDANATLAPGATLSCTASYLTTQADMALTSIATTATASGGGAGPSQPAGATVTKGAAQDGITPSANLTRGATIQHVVVSGEWLWQIARCYGADPTKAVQANSQLANPAQITPGITVKVPDIGSNGTIYGPPCVVAHTVASGDTWASIAQKYNADVGLLQLVNPGALTVGRALNVPRNSFGAMVSTPAVTATANLIRINFPSGATSTTVTGSAPTGSPARYVITAGQGQVMSVRLTAAANSAGLAVYAPNGSLLKQADLTPTWSGTLSAAGDYRIDVSNALGSGAPDVAYTLEVSVTGACVEATRDLKLITPAAMSTRFNICGTLDASGKLKVSSIYIYQRPADASAADFTQTITIPTDTWTPQNDPNSLIVEDMNADGYTDFRIMNSPAGGAVTYLYFVFDPVAKQFIFNGAR